MFYTGDSVKKFLNELKEEGVVLANCSSLRLITQGAFLALVAISISVIPGSKNLIAALRALQYGNIFLYLMLPIVIMAVISLATLVVNLMRTGWYCSGNIVKHPRALRAILLGSNGFEIFFSLIFSFVFFLLVFSVVVVVSLQTLSRGFVEPYEAIEFIPRLFQILLLTVAFYQLLVGFVGLLCTKRVFLFRVIQYFPHRFLSR